MLRDVSGSACKARAMGTAQLQFAKRRHSCFPKLVCRSIALNSFNSIRQFVTAHCMFNGKLPWSAR